MSKTNFSGPVYGAKALLWSHQLDVGIVSTAVQTLGTWVLPAYQDIFLTELHGFKASTSTSATLTISDDSTRSGNASTRTLMTVALGSSLANANGSTTPAADAGEFEGVRVAALSTITYQVQQTASSAAALVSSGLAMWVYGFIRFINSTRAEQ